MDAKQIGDTERQREVRNTESQPLIQSSSVEPGVVFPGSFGAKSTSQAFVTSRSKLHRDYLLVGWLDPSIWKSAFIELVGSASLCYTSGLIDVTLQNLQNPDAIPAYVGISNIVLLALFIYATAPASGGHINPVISFSTCLAGLTPLPRAVPYMIGQLSGAALAGGLLRGSLGHAASIRYHGGGCFRLTDQVSAGQAFIIECFCTFILLYLSFGCGLDPRQAQIFGQNAPLLVGLSLGLVTFAGTNLAPGYTGASMNPARCFAFAIAENNFKDQWIWWFGPAAGSLLLAMVYSAVPPYHAKKNL